MFISPMLLGAFQPPKSKNTIYCGTHLMRAGTSLRSDLSRDPAILLFLLTNLEDDFEFNRHPEGKAGNANHQPHR